MSLTIRTACTNDLPQVEPLHRDLLQGPSHPQELSLEERICEFFLVAEEEGRILGMLIAGPAPVDEVDRAMLPDMFPGCKRFLQIQELYVLPQYRSRGVGAALVREVIRRGRAAGLPHVMVYTDGTDATGDDYFRRIRFYQHCGFHLFQTFLTQGPDSDTASSAPVITRATEDTTSEA